MSLMVEQKIVLRLYCDHYGRPLVSGLHCGQTGARDKQHESEGERERPPGDRVISIPADRAARMKRRSPSEQHHGKRSRVSAAAASTLHEDTMEDKTPSNPRELTQNPLKKIWMPCKNGLPEKHISQRKGAYDSVAAIVSICMYSLCIYLWCNCALYQQRFHLIRLTCVCNSEHAARPTV